MIRHADHDPGLICRPAGHGLCELLPAAALSASETIPLGGGDRLEVRPATRTTVTRNDDGTAGHSDPRHVEANVLVVLRDGDGFAFSISPERARALAAAVGRLCPDADPAGPVLEEVMRRVAERWGDDASEGPYCKQEIVNDIAEILAGLGRG